MSTNAVGGTNTASQTTNPAVAAGAANNPSKALGKDAFLNLLVTQLQHQDPTQPQDDSQFAAQLAQFSSLEQLQQMNQTLAQIAQFFDGVQSTQGKV